MSDDPTSHLDVRHAVRPAILPADVMDDLLALCETYHVASLDLFGSAATGKFDPSTSDLDFLVEFPSLPGAGRADAYFGLHDALQALFQRRVDLVTDRSVRNPYLRQAIDRTRRRLFPVA